MDHRNDWGVVLRDYGLKGQLGGAERTLVIDFLILHASCTFEAENQLFVSIKMNATKRPF